VTFGALFDDVPMPGVGSLDDVRSQAETRLVVEGTVVGSEVGFYSGTPFTVVKVRVTRTNRPSPLANAYLLIPKGTLSVEGVTLSTSDPRYTAVPSNGDAILFLAGEAVDSDGTLFRVPAEHIFVAHDGVVVVAPRLRRSGTPPGSLTEIREMLDRPK